MKNRNNIQVTGLILESTKEKGRDGIRISQLISKSNVPHPRLSKIVEKLINNDLLVKFTHEKGQSFAITEKGMIYLNEYKKFYELANSFGMEL